MRISSKHCATLLGHTESVTAAKLHPTNPDVVATSCTDLA